MKLIICILFMLSLLGDFNSSSIIEGEALSIFETLSDCEKTDNKHSEHQSEHHDHHCHIGHVHTALIFSNTVDIKPQTEHFLSYVYLYSVGKVSHYLSEVIRPPIF